MADVRPVVVDMGLEDEQVRETMLAALRGPHPSSPIVALVNYGFEDLFRQAVSAAPRPEESFEACVPIALDFLDSDVRQRLQDALLALSKKICGILTCQKFDEELEHRGMAVEGQLSLRCYPRAAANKLLEERQDSSHACPLLGPHVDGNFLTLLWSDGVGFQVPSVQARIRPEEVAGMGIPSFGMAPSTEMEEEEWADVVSERDAILMSVGQGWFHSFLQALCPGVPCPVLHRVAVSKRMDRDRCSFPFLAKLVSKEAS
eukprot:763043-Hanusia_phi.AAC.1